MSLPKQLQDQADFIEAMDAQILAEVPPPPPVEYPEGEAPPAPAAPAAPQAQETPPAPPAPPVDWEHRFNTLQGVHRADNARNEGRIRDLEGKLSSALHDLQEAVKQPRAPEAPKPSAITEADIERFGPDFLDVVSRKATEVAESMTAPLKSELSAKDAEINRLKEQLGGVTESTQRTAQATYAAELTKLCPTWEAVNVDPQFHGWLAEVDPMSGLQRQAYLNDAFKALDHARTATLFNSYLQSAAPAPAPLPPAPNPLAAHTAPVASRADVAPTTEPSKKIWTNGEVEAFYEGVRKRAYTLTEAARIEAEIDAAVATGRVKG